MTIDQRAARGFKDAEHYDAYRPGYPPGVVAFIREAARLDHCSTVVDVGAGSGLMTRQLKPAGRLIAVEPLPEMRDTLRAPRDRLLAAIDAALEPYRADTPRFASVPWRAVFDADSSPLVITEHAVFPWEEPLTLGVLKGRARSYSYIATLDGPVRAAVMNTLDEVAAACLGGPVTDETPLSIKHVTEVFVARRR